jgi:hypothetical protein
MPSLPPTVGHSGAPRTVDVTAGATIAARLTEIPALREGGWPDSAPPLPRRFLRHADEQTVVGMHAILAAIDTLPEPRTLEGNGMIAASCQAGRIVAAQTLVQATAGGGVTVSTQLVPQGSLHSLAGAVSVGLGMRGPNIGVSGGPDAVSEGVLVAFSWLDRSGPVVCDTAWLVITGWDDEPALDAEGIPTTDPVCRGVALAVARAAAASSPGSQRLSLQLDPHGVVDTPPTATASSLRSLADALAAHDSNGSPADWARRLPWGATVRLARAGAASRQEAA